MLVAFGPLSTTYTTPKDAEAPSSPPEPSLVHEALEGSRSSKPKYPRFYMLENSSSHEFTKKIFPTLYFNQRLQNELVRAQKNAFNETTF